VTAVQVLDRVVRPAPIGLRFRDVATGGFVGEGLRVTVTSVRNPARTATLDVNGKAVWYAHRFPGFSDTELANSPDWETLRQPCLVEVDDRLGRFLPLRIILDLPHRGLIDWPGWGDLPQDLLVPLANDASPPAISPDALPLFSSAGRIAPMPLAEIRCQLLRDDGGPAAWALLTATHAGLVRAIGQADAEGRAVLFFAYPERPRPSLATSPPAITDFRWSIELAAYWNGLDRGADGAARPSAHSVRVHRLAARAAAVAAAQLRARPRAAHRHHSRWPVLLSRHGGVMKTQGEP
jgi:hypothetical protein